MYVCVVVCVWIYLLSKFQYGKKLRKNLSLVWKLGDFCLPFFNHRNTVEYPHPNDPEKFWASHLHLARRGFLLRQAISQALELRSERLAGCGRDFAAGALGNGEIIRISWEFMGLLWFHGETKKCV